MKQCSTTCPYCGVGCGVTATLDGAEVIAVVGDEEHPANAGRLCVKGTSLAATLVREGRLLHPTYGGERTSWDNALDKVADKIRSVREQYGPDAIAFYLSGQLLTEDYYVANKLMKGFLGSANVDTNSRLCMSSAVAGYKRAFGADLVPCSYEDLETCDLLLMVGSNAAWTHPVTYQRIVAAKKSNPSRRVVVIDPRRTASCDVADLHLQIKPGSDGFLFAGLLKHLQRDGRINEQYVQAHTEGLSPALAALASLDDDRVGAATGLSVYELQTFYQWFSATEKTVTLYSQGINQSATGTDKCNAIINCHLATGRLGKPGAGPFSITGQPNAMGGREVGGLANQLAAHMDFRPDDIDRVGRFWQAPAMATQQGLKAVDMFQAAAQGKIRFLWIMATNPAVSLPDTALVRQALERCECVVVSDCSAATDTAAYADILLPAMGWGEKDGTVTNSERCISRQRKLVDPAGEARADWWAVAQVARRLGFGAAFAYDRPADIFAEHARLSGFENEGVRDFDISGLAGLDYQEYDRLQPTVWPVPAGGVSQRPLADGHFYTESGRARFVAVRPELPASAIAGGSPRDVILNTGRFRDQWHTMTRTGTVPKLMRHRDFYSLSMNSHTAQLAQLDEGDLVTLNNQGGSVCGQVLLDEGVASGQVFSPIHWSDQFSGSACISRLIPSVTDPVSGQPQSKYAQVTMAAVPLACWGMLFTRRKLPMPALPYWSSIAVEGGYLTLLAVDDIEDAVPAARATLHNLLQQPGLDHLEYVDSADTDYRDMGWHSGQLQYALFLRSQRRALPQQSWLASLGGALSNSAPAALLAGMDPSGEDAGRMICSCWEVGEKTIAAAVQAGAGTVEDLGKTLRCGTQCGSCVPELRQFLMAGRKECAA